MVPDGSLLVGEDVFDARPCFAKLLSFLSWQIARKFWFPSTVQSKIAWEQGWRNPSVEIVRIDPDNVAAQASRGGFRWQDRVGSQSRHVRKRVLVGVDPPSVSVVCGRPIERRFTEEEDRQRRGSVQIRVQQGQVSRARQELTGFRWSQRNSATLEELRRKRPQACRRKPLLK